MNYTWNGQPVTNIHEWCRDRGEQMARVRKTWHVPVTVAALRAGDEGERSEVMEMPVVFFESMRFGGPHDEQYHEIERYDP